MSGFYEFSDFVVIYLYGCGCGVVGLCDNLHMCVIAESVRVGTVNSI